MGDGRLSPFVYWAQNESNVFLRIDLKNVKSPEVHLSEDELEFISSGLGARGQNEYHFVLEFYEPINPKESQYRISDRQVDFNIKKKEEASWPRLITQTVKPAWLKIDFDKWKPDTEDEEFDEDRANNMYERVGLPDEWKMESKYLRNNRKFTLQSSRKLYLFLYNLFQCFGYGFIVFSLIKQYMKDGPASLKNTYENIGWCLKFSQSVQLMEIVHRLLKYTKTSLRETIIQTCGRCFMLFIMIEAEPRMQTKPVVFYLMFVWCSIDVIRYAYYMLRIYKIDIGFVTWLRYTLWIPLYPLGFLCEGIIILRNIPYFEETEKFSLSLPNKWNFSFHLPSIMRIYLLLFLFPTLYMLMNYMYYQRKVKLGIKPEDKKK